MLPLLRLLARLKPLRGTPLDIFGYTADRKMERALIKQFEADMKTWLPKASPELLEPLIALSELPLQINGFGPVKHAAAQTAAKRREELLAVLAQGGAQNLVVHRPLGWAGAVVVAHTLDRARDERAGNRPTSGQRTGREGSGGCSGKADRH